MGCLQQGFEILKVCHSENAASVILLHIVATAAQQCIYMQILEALNMSQGAEGVLTCPSMEVDCSRASSSPGNSFSARVFSTCKIPETVLLSTHDLHNAFFFNVI